MVVTFDSVAVDNSILTLSLQCLPLQEAVETKPSIAAASTSTRTVPKKVWTTEELKRSFMPILQRLWKLEESLPFHQPVDPVALCIPVSRNCTDTPFPPLSTSLHLPYLYFYFCL